MISLFAAEERAAKRERLGDPLQVLDRAIDFAALACAGMPSWRSAAAVAATVRRIRRS